MHMSHLLTFVAARPGVGIGEPAVLLFPGDPSTERVAHIGSTSSPLTLDQALPESHWAACVPGFPVTNAGHQDLARDSSHILLSVPLGFHQLSLTLMYRSDLCQMSFWVLLLTVVDFTRG